MTAFATVGIAAALGAILALGTAEHALAAQPQPGQWKLTTKTTMTGVPGMPAGMGAEEKTQMKCITPEQAKDPRKAFEDAEGGRRGGQGRTTKRDWNGSVLTIDSTCGGNPPSTVKGTMTFDTPTHYRGEMKSTTPTGGTLVQITVTMKGQRVGECPR